MKSAMKSAMKAALLCLAMAAPALAQTGRITSPPGGWVNSSLGDGAQTLTYAYPNNLIDRGGQRGRTLIEGHIRQHGKSRRLPVLVVNGNPLPLTTGPDGRFARPYSFGPGANGMALRDAEGRTVQQVQFFDANRTKPSARVRIILAWDDPQAELDLHVITPDGQHAYFANPVLQGGGGMDVDSVDGAGPEMFSLTVPLPGAYHVYLNYWGNFNAGGYHFDDATRQRDLITARVTLVFNENTAAERREQVNLPLRKIGELTHVRSFSQTR
jgi:uncharacterized protein YfaP (DUF2135 family)